MSHMMLLGDLQVFLALAVWLNYILYTFYLLHWFPLNAFQTLGIKQMCTALAVFIGYGEY